MSVSMSFLDICGAVVRDQKGLLQAITADEGCWNLVGGLFLACLAGGMAHGLTLGIKRGGMQVLASILKAPLVPLATLGITGPLLYLVNAMRGGTGTVPQVAAVALLPMASAGLLVLAATPILLFFTASAKYQFLKRLHVGTFALLSIHGMGILLVAVNTVGAGSGIVKLSVVVPWIAAYAFVGAQMAWVLRPLLGEPKHPFEWFRKDSEGLDFYSALFRGDNSPMG